MLRIDTSAPPARTILYLELYRRLADPSMRSPKAI